MEKLPVCAALWMLVWSLALFSLMGRDKRLARMGGRRIPEKRLFLLAALGGAVGGVAGMAVFRHKQASYAASADCLCIYSGRILIS